MEIRGQFGHQGVTFLVSIFLARLLEPEQFGMVAMVKVIVGISNNFTNLGFSISLVQRKRLHAIL